MEAIDISSKLMLLAAARGLRIQTPCILSTRSLEVVDRKRLHEVHWFRHYTGSNLLSEKIRKHKSAISANNLCAQTFALRVKQSMFISTCAQAKATLNVKLVF